MPPERPARGKDDKMGNLVAAVPASYISEVKRFLYRMGDMNVVHDAELSRVATFYHDNEPAIEAAFHLAVMRDNLEAAFRLALKGGDGA